jgi:hypothetical protein
MGCTALTLTPYFRFGKRDDLTGASQFCSTHPQSLFPEPQRNCESGSSSPKREKGLGDEGKRTKLGYSPLDSPIPSWENKLGQFFKMRCSRKIERQNFTLSPY